MFDGFTASKYLPAPEVGHEFIWLTTSVNKPVKVLEIDPL